jgi:hypothetical protein
VPGDGGSRAWDVTGAISGAAAAAAEIANLRQKLAAAEPRIQRQATVAPIPREKDRFPPGPNLAGQTPRNRTADRRHDAGRERRCAPCAAACFRANQG